MFRNHTDLIRTPINTEPTQPSELAPCELCDAAWQSDSDTFIHKEEHWEEIKTWIKEEQHVCLICVKLLDTRQNLIKHLKTAHLLSAPNAKRVEREIYVCNECSQIFFNKTMLMIHIFKEKYLHCNSCSHCTIQCMRCNKNASMKKIWSHLVQVHGILSLSTCKICFTKCKNARDLQNHVLTHPSYFFCDQCSLHLKDGNAFRSHIELHENESSKFKIAAVVDDEPEPKKSERLKKWRYPKIKTFSSTKLDGQLYVCILCRHICLDGFEKRKHLASHYTVLKNHTKVTKENIISCSCGETFTSNILKKYHLLKNKDHMVAELEAESKASERQEAGSSSLLTPMEYEVPDVNDVLERIFV